MSAITRCLVPPCSRLHSVRFRTYSVRADKQSLLSLEGRACTFINWIVQALNCYMYGSQLGLVMYGLSPRFTNHRIARVICINPPKGGLVKNRVWHNTLETLASKQNASHKLYFSRHAHIVSPFMSQNAILRSSYRQKNPRECVLDRPLIVTLGKIA